MRWEVEANEYTLLKNENPMLKGQISCSFCTNLLQQPSAVLKRDRQQEWTCSLSLTQFEE